jgi:hypothetical protein
MKKIIRILLCKLGFHDTELLHKIEMRTGEPDRWKPGFVMKCKFCNKVTMEV